MTCEICGNRLRVGEAELVDSTLTELHPYPETLRLCPGCARAQRRQLRDDMDRANQYAEERGQAHPYAERF